jgi:hypothetical protein
MMRKMVKSAGYVILVFGLLLSLALLITAFIFFMNYPHADFYRKLISTGGIVLAGFFAAYLAIAAFQLMAGVVGLENEVKELEDEVEELEKK